jgi:hypothetical protein
MGHGLRGLVNMGLRELPVVLRLVHFHALVEEAEDSPHILAADVTA